MRHAVVLASAAFLAGCGASAQYPVAVTAHTHVTIGCVMALDALQRRADQGRDVGGKVEEVMANCDSLLSTIEDLAEAHYGQ